jgi:O-antigen ligase
VSATVAEPVEAPAAPSQVPRAGRVLEAVTALVPGAAVVFLSFNGGGFFPTAPALVAVALAALLVLQVTTHPDPFGGLNATVGLAIGALGLLTVWTLLSAGWSDAPGRALLEFSRTLGYLLALVLFAAPARSPGGLAWLVRGLAAGLVVVCGIGLITRVLPEVWPIRPGFEDSRLSYPITYWNAFGILAALGTVLTFHLAASEPERWPARVLGAGAVPLLAVALFFSFSRGAVGACVVGLVAYVLVARPRALLPALLATAPAAFVALRSAYGADILATDDFASAAGVAEGKDVAPVVVLAMLAAAAVRAALLPLDRRLVAARLPDRWRRPVLGSAGALVLAAVIAVPLALGAPGYVERQYERFKEPLPVGLENRERFLVPSNNDRLDIWRVALDAFEAEPLHGTGAGTYALQWAQHRPERKLTVLDGHSMYVEMLGELGLVGAALLGIVLLALLGGTLLRARGPDRVLYGGVLAALVTWAVHAAVDWDWEMPAVTLWAFAVGGAAVASTRGGRLVPGRTVRVALGIGCAVLAVTPWLVAQSQSRLDDAVRALQVGDCRTAIDAALGSLEAVGGRAEPFEVLGYCDARLGLDEVGVQAMEQAVRRDPDNWRTHYGLAVVRAAARQDPRPAAARALELNPQHPLARDVAERFRDVDDPAAWERRARRARLPRL